MPDTFSELAARSRELERKLTQLAEDLSARKPESEVRHVKHYEFDAWWQAAEESIKRRFGESSVEYREWTEVNLDRQQDFVMRNFGFDSTITRSHHMDRFLEFAERNFQIIEKLALLYPSTPGVQTTIHVQNAGVVAADAKIDKPATESATRVDKFKRWVQSQPLLSTFIIIGIILAALATFTDSLQKLKQAVNHLFQPGTNTPSDGVKIGVSNATAPIATTVSNPVPPDDWNDPKWAKSRGSIDWVLGDQGAHQNYIDHIGKGKFESLLHAQEHNRGSYEAIAQYGSERTALYLKSLGQ